MTSVSAHFVEFLSPGTFMAESSVKPIAAWDVEIAKAMALEVVERHNARPYGFRFITRSRGPDDLDSHISAKSNLYYLGGEIRTLEEVERDNLPSEEILRSNMRNNDYSKIVTNRNSWLWTQPLNDGDVVLEFAFPSEPVSP